LSSTATGTPLKSPLSATVRSIEVSVGETLDQVKVAVVLEAMKTEVSVNVPRTLKGKTVSAIAVVPGDVISAGQALLYCE
jgi:biotin carboxyl carrier protein